MEITWGISSPHGANISTSNASYERFDTNHLRPGPCVPREFASTCNHVTWPAKYDISLPVHRYAKNNHRYRVQLGTDKGASIIKFRPMETNRTTRYWNIRSSS